jgi:preprotein translocase subunit SecB
MSQSTPAPLEQQGAQSLPLVVNVQYVKDMSFEVPGAPTIFAQLRSQPQVNINLDVQARRLPEQTNVYEVTLMIRAEATLPTPNGAAAPAAAPAPVLFVAELAYAGVFTLNNLPENAVEPVLLVECPRLLFPFARNILADVTRDGSFPPVLLQPIDFVALWQSRRQQAAAASAAQTTV